MKKYLLTLLPFATFILSGCGANYYAIHKVDSMESGKSSAVSVDAKQRFLLASALAINEGLSNTTNPQILHRFCAEASPDVFTALGQAVSGSGSFGQAASTQEISLALKGAFSSTETSSTIARTQTINILKEMMYRTCERYLNGSIGDDEYPIVAARDQRVITSILAIEQLTGATLAKPIVIASEGSNLSEDSTGDAVVRIDDAKKDADQKKARLKESEDAYGAINNPPGRCSDLASRRTGLTDIEMQTKEECSSKKKTLDAATIASTEAIKHYADLVALVKRGGKTSTVTSAQLLSNSSLTNIDLEIEKERSRRVTSVAEIVRHIVDSNFNQDDETSFFCYRNLATASPESPIRRSCVEFLTKRTEKQAELKANEIARIKLDTQRYQVEYKSSLERLDNQRNLQFEIFWNKIRSDSDRNLADKRKLDTLVNRALGGKGGNSQKDELENLRKMRSKEEIRNGFDGLAPKIRELLGSP